MSVKTIRGNLLFWKISAVFAGLLLVLAIVFVLIGSRFSKTYYMAAHQQLYGDIAGHLATFTQPIKNGRPDTTVTHDIIHSTMVANPSVEVYLLDTLGNITDYVVPQATVQMKSVDMDKVQEWLAVDDNARPLGDNPKHPGEASIFSAAPVFENGKLAGYVYAVLASEKQQEILSSLNGDLNLRLAAYIFFAALLGAFVVGVVTFFLITDSICSIAGVVKRFKEGDYSARIRGYARGNLGVLTSTFNEMADVIVENFEKITATDRFRQELISNVSHDLRTPLSIMQGYAETLVIKRETLSPAETERYLSIVLDGTKKLSVLVEQLFQYSKLESNVVEPQKELFPIGELVSDILSAYQLKAEQRNICLKLDAPAVLSAVFADIGLTERIFQNLLDNAFKFTPNGGQISITLSEASDGVRIRVEDTGVGIAKEYQEQIFERYKQADLRAASAKGAGLGLAIVRKILELHQSSIRVFSEHGKGAAFEFVLSSR
ncbi:HAMP domain-containing sensor histidine kinase [Dyadobacter pollutisoli]|jgi:signal transduction histidine kinase|uniref:histidine kinase n=1 Tax=Dyadobacter pollutisoli TaxID=2910158 RepID=A0A9E8NGN4_9BACT|nr:HAMP domain-containing sensor histidine kinase [Dyadobacter pollutisoli]WAC14968.1 HAMP domain-containing sensor histidine kinase [Dyadobacter pollutisoli]